MDGPIAGLSGQALEHFQLMTSLQISAAWTRTRHNLRRLLSYQQRFGWRATLQRLRREWGAPPSAMPAAMPGQEAPVPSAAQWAQARFEALTPLRTWRMPRQVRQRVSLVTDSIGKGSLFGGVGTALILATLVANRRGADLRIITRTEPPVPANLDHVLQVYGLSLHAESQFRFAPPHDTGSEIDLMEDELVITTSWWTTAACLPGVGLASLVYLLQEDERMFYAFGDERLRCERLLHEPGLRCVVNTRLLLDHFIADGFADFRQRAQSFEPAFPASVFWPRERAVDPRRRFVFYARPNNARNLFFLGLEVIEAAINRGVLDPQHWDIVFVGKDIPDVALAGKHLPIKRENLDWQAYAELVGGADLGLSLMYTPHPSYPPLDLVASGAVVVSNRFGLKQDLSHLSRNLILCDAERESLVDGLARGVALALDTRLRAQQFRDSALSRDWQVSLQAVVDNLAGQR